MKCPKCGANLTIDDELCSFCGVENPFAEKHREEMRHFTKDFNRTKSQVLAKTQIHSKFVAKVTLVAIMIILNFIIWIIDMNSYEVEQFLLNSRISKNYIAHKTALDGFEDERNFIGFYVYSYGNSLYRSDLFDEYRAAYDTASRYETIYSEIMDLYTVEDAYEYESDELKVETIAREIEYLYKYAKPGQHSDRKKYSEKHQAFIDDAVAQTEQLLHTYLNIPKEEMEQFKNLSTARKQIRIEEGLGINE